VDKHVDHVAPDMTIDIFVDEHKAVGQPAFGDVLGDPVTKPGTPDQRDDLGMAVQYLPKHLQELDRHLGETAIDAYQFGGVGKSGALGGEPLRIDRGVIVIPPLLPRAEPQVKADAGIETVELWVIKLDPEYTVDV